MLTSITTEDYYGNKTTETIDYDQIGNPLTYRGATMSWFGRQLRTYSKGSTSANFVYDADGLRSAKAVNGTTTTYQYVGDQLFYEKIGENKILYYFYDSYGKLAAIYYTYKNGSNVSSARYHVATNAQGDVIALYNSNGVKVGAYDYDAWGNQRVFVVTQNAAGANVHTQINPETEYLNHIVNVNPMRYRGYYYDSDLGLYYLQSRYYDASIGRFINADEYVTTDQGVLSYNGYAYCGSNPVIRADSGGDVWHIVAGALIGTVTGVAVELISSVSTEKEIDPRQLIVSGLFGALSGALSATGMGAVAHVVTNAVISGAESVVSQGIENGFKNIDYGEVSFDAAVGGATAGKPNFSIRESKHLLKQGMKHIKTPVKGSALKKATKHYVSQTKFVMKREFWSWNSAKSFIGSSRDAIISKTIKDWFGW